MNWLPLFASPLEGARVADEFGALALGVGKVASTLELTRRLALGEPVEAVLLFGICGAYPPSHRTKTFPLDLLDLCVVTDDQLADEGVAAEGGFIDLARMGFGSIGPYPADPSLTEQVASSLAIDKRVRGATVSSCSGSDERSLEIARRTSADVETMEGGAVAAVCQRFDIPWVQVRCVSNFCGRRDEGAFQIEKACERIQYKILRLLRAGSRH